jgi:hypothetical protein
LLPTHRQGKPVLNRSGKLSKSYVKNNAVYMFFLFWYFAINVVLFATRAADFWLTELPDGSFVYGDYLFMLARGSGQFTAHTWSFR